MTSLIDIQHTDMTFTNELEQKLMQPFNSALSSPNTVVDMHPLPDINDLL